MRVEVLPVFGDGAPAVWRWSPPRVDERPDDLVCRRVRGRDGDRVDVFQKDWLEPGRRKKLRTVWLSEEVGSTDTAVAELKALVGHVFESPKPTGLLRRVLATMPDDVRVLDFFAGSRHHRPRRRAGQRRRRRHPHLPLGRHRDAGASGVARRPAGYATVADVTRARLRAVAETVGGGFADDTPRGAPWLRRSLCDRDHTVVEEVALRPSHTVVRRSSATVRRWLRRSPATVSKPR